MDKLVIRPAAARDAEGINSVYNPFIRESAATFETEEYSVAKRGEWLAALKRSPSTPVFVASDEEGRIFGFANAAPFDPRQGYATSVKVSVFVDPVRQGEGLARRLYEALFDALSGLEIHRAYGLIVKAPDRQTEAIRNLIANTFCETAGAFIVINMSVIPLMDVDRFLCLVHWL